MHDSTYNSFRLAS